MRAYDEIYLTDAMRNLADALDYAVNTCKVDIDWFGNFFLVSGAAKEFGRGNPHLVSGMSGEELVKSIYYKIYKEDILPEHSFSFDKSPEYWLGWVLAYYQWYTAKDFGDIIGRVSLSTMIKMYPTYHKMDILRFVEEIDRICNDKNIPTKLKTIRENRGFSQSQLAKKSTISLRAIQLYEQKVNNIDRASVQTVYKLARALYCDIEDLLENPQL